MDAIRFKGYINSIRAKVDGSLGLNMGTPELTSKQKAAFMDIQNINLDIMLEPLDAMASDTIVVDKDIDQKSPSKRLYNVLYVLWKQQGEVGNFYNDFYMPKMEKAIESIKKQLED